MKVIVLTEGGAKIGFGHIIRCAALCEAFIEKGIETELLVNGDRDILDLLSCGNSSIYDWIKNEKELLKNISKSDFIIIDSYLADKSIYYKISEITGGKMLMIDDNNRLSYPKGIVVNSSIYGDKIKYPQKEGLFYLLGKDYIILRKEFWDVPEKKINREIKNILITFGGMGKYDLMQKMIQFLNKKFSYELNPVIVAEKKLGAKEMLDLMLKTDICISGGGQTTNELARVGVPTIGICFADNQKNNLLSWEKTGVLKSAGWYNGKNLFKNIEEKFNELDYISRLKISRKSRNYIDGEGARNIVRYILSLI